MNIKMILPKKDKYGNSYLSYSQIALFKRSKEDYFDQYIIGKKFEGNAYTDFGSKVGEAIENNNFDNFNLGEKETLKKVTRLDLFERKTILNYNSFYIIGYIDSLSSNLKTLIDYKTGGERKELEYSKPEYTQLHLYALSLRQETGVTPDEASVEFIRRKGNAFKGDKLTVGDEVIKIELDISYKNLKSVYWDTLNTANEISEFYKKNKL